MLRMNVDPMGARQPARKPGDGLAATRPAARWCSPGPPRASGRGELRACARAPRQDSAAGILRPSRWRGTPPAPPRIPAPARGHPKPVVNDRNAGRRGDFPPDIAAAARARPHGSAFLAGDGDEAEIAHRGAVSAWRRGRSRAPACRAAQRPVRSARPTMPAPTTARSNSPDHSARAIRLMRGAPR